MIGLFYQILPNVPAKVLGSNQTTYVKGLSDLEGNIPIRKYLENSSSLNVINGLLQELRVSTYCGVSLIKEFYRDSGDEQRFMGGECGLQERREKHEQS